MFIKQEVEPTLKEKLKHFVFDVVGCCQDVHREQGPELTEYVYQDSLKIAFEQAQIKFVKEYFFHPTFRGKELPSRLQLFPCHSRVQEILLRPIFTHYLLLLIFFLIFFCFFLFFPSRQRRNPQYNVNKLKKGQ